MNNKTESVYKNTQYHIRKNNPNEFQDIDISFI